LSSGAPNSLAIPIAFGALFAPFAHALFQFGSAQAGKLAVHRTAGNCHGFGSGVRSHARHWHTLGHYLVGLRVPTFFAICGEHRLHASGTLASASAAHTSKTPAAGPLADTGLQH
jgi:hypothetical protein